MDFFYMFANIITNHYDEFNNIMNYHPELLIFIMILIIMTPLFLAIMPLIFTYFWLFEDSMDTRQSFYSDMDVKCFF